MPAATIEVNTHIEAPIETVFSFFADPARFRQWFEHGSLIEPGPGGRVEIRSPMGPPATGPIEAWEPNRRIVFLFGHPEGSGMLPPASSTVTVTFAEERGGTRVSIRHSGIADEAMRRGAGSGWQAGLGRLAGACWRHRLGDRLPRLLEAWTKAWQEPDRHSRRALLAECFGERASFRDMFARIDDREALVDWIGGVQQMMPGLMMEPTAAAHAVQGHLTWPWRVVAPDGSVVGTGHQYAELGPDLLMAASIGFWTPPAGTPNG